MKWSSCHERGAKKKSESPIGVEPTSSQTPGGCSILWAKENLWKAMSYTRFTFDTRPAYCYQQCRDRTVCVWWTNERWWIQSSVKQMRRWNNQHVTSVGQRKNLSLPRQDSNLWPPKYRAGALSTWATENSRRARLIILGLYLTPFLHIAWLII